MIESGISSVINAGWGIVRGKDELLGTAGRMIARSTVDFFVNYTKVGSCGHKVSGHVQRRAAHHSTLCRLTKLKDRFALFMEQPTKL